MWARYYVMLVVLSVSHFLKIATTGNGHLQMFKNGTMCFSFCLVSGF